MKLRDLIIHLRRNILRDWSDRVGGSDDDRLWSDQHLVDWINEGQRRLARKAFILRDDGPNDATMVQLRSGVDRYVLSDQVVAVISARYDADQRDLQRVGHDELNIGWRSDQEWFDPRWGVALPPGRPVAFGMDETLQSDGGETFSAPVLKLWPAPDVASTGKFIRLRIARLPRKFLLDDLDMPSEIPEDYQLECLSWAAFRALSIVDYDQGAPERASAFRAQFEAMSIEARRDVMRKMFTPNRWRFTAGAYTR